MLLAQWMMAHMLMRLRWLLRSPACRVSAWPGVQLHHERVSITTTATMSATVDGAAATEHASLL